MDFPRDAGGYLTIFMDFLNIAEVDHGERNKSKEEYQEAEE